MLPSIANTLASVVTDILQENQERNAAKEELKKAIERVRQERQEASNRHKRRMERKRAHLDSLKQTWNTRRQQELPLHQYACELKGLSMNPPPSHILLLQARVMRAVHQLCVATAQLQLLERTLETLQVLAKGQEGNLLDKVLWAVEAKVELQQQESFQQEEDEQIHMSISNDSNCSHDDDSDPSSMDSRTNPQKERRDDANTQTNELDSLVNHLSSLKLKHVEDQIYFTNHHPLPPTSSRPSTTYILDVESMVQKDPSENGIYPFEQRPCSEVIDLAVTAVLSVEEEDSVPPMKSGEQEPNDLRNDSLVLVDALAVDPNTAIVSKEEDWEEITFEHLKSDKRNVNSLDVLLDDKDDEQIMFHQSLPTLHESRGEKRILNRRASMVTQGNIC